MLKNSLGVLLALCAALAAPQASRAERSDPDRVLLLSASSADAARLERGLNDSTADRLFVVFHHAPKKDGSDVPAALARYAPKFVVASGALRAAAPAGAVIAEGGEIEALLGRAGAARAAVSPEESENRRRRVAEAHRDFATVIRQERLVAALAAQPDDAGALEQLVEISLAHGRLWQALDGLERIAASARASGPRRVEARRQAGELRLQFGDFPGAAKDFQFLLESLPEDSGLLRLLAEAKREHPEEALPFADRAAGAPGATAAQRALANRLAGELRMDTGDASGAEKNLALALRDAPADLDALSAMTRLKRDTVYAERADRAAARAPLWQRAAAQRLSARVWLDLGEPVRAAGNLRRALRFNPEDIDVLRQLVAVKSRLGPKELAGLRRATAAAAETAAPASSEAELRRALTENPKDLEALRRLAELSRRRKRPAEAAAYAERFAAAAWQAPVWHREDVARALVDLWLGLGETEKATLVLERLLELPSDSIANWNMAVKIPDYRTRLESYSWVLGSYCTAAELRLSLGDRAGAEKEIELALKLQPDHAQALQLKARLKKES